MSTVTREQNEVVYSDGYRMMETVWVVIRRKPNRFKFFLSRKEAWAEGGEVWSRSMYEAADGSIENWTNFVQDKPLRRVTERTTEGEG